MDIVGLITLKASNEHRFIFVVIDYFTKWVEAALYVNVTRLVICEFLKKKVTYQYGLPEKIISNNAKNLNNALIEEVCTKFKNKHHNFMPYRPKMNGPVEAANKNIKKIISKTT